MASTNRKKKGRPPKAETSTPGGVHVEGDITVMGDWVGRDKIIGLSPSPAPGAEASPSTEGDKGSGAWTELREGALRKFGFVQIDLAGHSAIAAANATRPAAATFSAFLDFIEEQATAHGGRTWSMAGDGALFAFCDDDVTTMAEQATATALAIVDGLPAFNRTRSQVKQPVRVRVAVHLGEARYAAQTGRIQSDDLNFVAHLEKGGTAPDSVSISGHVYRELAQEGLKARFRDNGTFEGQPVYTSALPPPPGSAPTTTTQDR